MNAGHAVQKFICRHGVKLAPWLLFTIFVGIAANAQEANVWVNVSPREAYVFLGGEAIGDGTHQVDHVAGQAPS